MQRVLKGTKAYGGGKRLNKKVEKERSDKEYSDPYALTPFPVVIKRDKRKGGTKVQRKKQKKVIKMKRMQDRRRRKKRVRYKSKMMRVLK
jgi:hypothetical protein